MERRLRHARNDETAYTFCNSRCQFRSRVARRRAVALWLEDGEQDALRVKLQRIGSWGLPKRALRGVLSSRRKLVAFWDIPGGHAFADRWAWVVRSVRDLSPRIAAALNGLITHDAGYPAIS